MGFTVALTIGLALLKWAKIHPTDSLHEHDIDRALLGRQAIPFLL